MVISVWGSHFGMGEMTFVVSGVIWNAFFASGGLENATFWYVALDNVIFCMWGSQKCIFSYVGSRTFAKFRPPLLPFFKLNSHYQNNFVFKNENVHKKLTLMNRCSCMISIWSTTTFSSITCKVSVWYRFWNFWIF